MTCLRLVEQHFEAAKAAGHVRREAIAAYIFDLERETLQFSADQKASIAQEAKL